MATTCQMSYQEALLLASKYLQEEKFQQARLIALQLIISPAPANEHFRLLAHIAYKEGKFEEGLNMVDKGIAISNINLADFCEIRGILLKSLHCDEEARKAFKESLLLKPLRSFSYQHYFEYALNNQNRTTCEEALDLIATIKPKIDPDNESDFLGDLYEKEGVALLYLRRFSEALQAFLMTLKTAPLNAHNFFNVGITYSYLNEPKQCIHYVEQGLALRKLNESALHKMIESYLSLKQPEQAFATLKKYFKQSHLNYETTILLGRIYKDLQQYDEAKKLFEDLIKKHPQNHQAYAELGLVYRAMDELEKALVIYQKAIFLFPDNSSLHTSLGIVLRLLGDFTSSEKAFKHAIELSPEAKDNFFNLSLVLLTQGNFKEGWKCYQERTHIRDAKGIRKNLDRFIQPLWQGQNLDDKTILVHCEQGAGDSIQFCRYLPWLSTKAKKVLFIPSKHLEDLFTFNQERLHVDIPLGKTLTTADFSYQAPLLQLPIIHQTDLSTIFREIPYLKADPLRKERFLPLFTTKKFKIGFCWQGQPLHGEDRYRSNKLTDWLPLIEEFKNDIQFYSFQKGFGEEQLSSMSDHESVIPVGCFLNDYADTAAALEMLDLVISIDSSVVHLCGALGKPTWILLPPVPDWRWLLEREDSPWYPTARLFRKKRSESWQQFFIHISSCLKNLLKNT